jgi:PAS domain S-box-containing protein
VATILIVDDLAANRSVLVTLLGHHGHRMIEAEDGRAALASIRADPPDLVIADVLMPVMDGYELVKQIRLDPAISAIPVVFSTAHYAAREARALAHVGGVSDVLTKPSASADVLRVVGRVLAADVPAATPLGASVGIPAFDREHLRLVMNKLSQNAEDLRATNARLRALINVGLDLASGDNSDALLQSVCVAARELFGASHVTLGIASLNNLTVQRFVTCGAEPSDWIKAGDRVSGILATVVSERRALRGINPEGDPVRLALPPRHPRVRAYLAAPLTSLTQVYGWFCLVGSDDRPFSEEDEDLVIALSGQIGRVYENVHLHELAERRAEELEQEILRRTAVESALRTSERLNRNLVEHLPHRIVVKDRASVILFCNANYARDLGIAPDAAVGKCASAFYPRELADAYDADDQAVITNGVMRDIEEPHLAGGQERWVHTVKVPYRDEEGRIIGVLVVFEDITERKRLEGQARQSQKLEAIGRLAGGIAHDFNNLLTAILGYCELLLDDLEPDAPHWIDVMEIQKAGTSAAELTRQLLVFGRKQIVEPTFVDLNAVVSEMQSLLGRLIHEDITMVFIPGPSLACVRADRGQLGQIVMNLAVNARDAMPAGGALTIETANVDLDEDYAATHFAVKPGKYVALTVTDTGAGMTPAVQAQVFEPFFTTKAIGQGTGLGLATVHGIVTESAGSVAVYSEPGRGTTFKVYLPSAADGARATPSPPPLALRPDAVTETVLVVDDADGLRDLARRLLERLGYTVLVASGADEACRLFEDGASIDVLLTDVVMPGLSGPELTRSLVDRWPDLRVVYMSGYTEDSIIRRGVLDPGVAFLHKPFTSATLARTIRGALER